MPSKSNDNCVVPPSWKLISPVVELRSNDPVESIDMGLAAIVNPVFPSCVNVASLPTPKLKTAESDKSFMSFPATISLTTERPPSV